MPEVSDKDLLIIIKADDIEINITTRHYGPGRDYVSVREEFSFIYRGQKQVVRMTKDQLQTSYDNKQDLLFVLRDNHKIWDMAGYVSAVIIPEITEQNYEWVEKMLSGVRGAHIYHNQAEIPIGKIQFVMDNLREGGMRNEQD